MRQAGRAVLEVEIIFLLEEINVLQVTAWRELFSWPHLEELYKYELFEYKLWKIPFQLFSFLQIRGPKLT